MKKTVKLGVSVLCVALCVALGAVVVSCGSTGGGGGGGKSPAGTGILAVGEMRTFIDEDNGGSSTAEITSAEETIGGQTVTTYTIKGNVTTGYQYGFAGWALDPDDVTLDRIKKATGISFTILGDGKKYAVKYKTKECESDYCYYEYVFDTKPGEPVTIEVPIKFFQQPPWGQWKAFKQESFTGLEWQTHESWRKSPTDNPFEAKIWDVKIFNN